jgi:ribosomal protein S18 acetylase RimI-like enzyme
VQTAYAFRSARPDDYKGIVAVVDRWWGRPIAAALQRLFLDHFWRTSLIVEDPTGADRKPALAGFLVGFLSPGAEGEAYIHFVGVAPDARGSGLGRALYEEFFAGMRAHGCTVVHAVTSPVNVESIAFHRAMGFDVSGPVVGYDGPGADRVVFTRAL